MALDPHRATVCRGCARTFARDPYAFDNLMAVCRSCHDNMHEQIKIGSFWCSFEGVRDAVHC